jgi:hypothetical protein
MVKSIYSILKQNLFWCPVSLLAIIDEYVIAIEHYEWTQNKLNLSKDNLIDSKQLFQRVMVMHYRGHGLFSPYIFWESKLPEYRGIVLVKHQAHGICTQAIASLVRGTFGLIPKSVERVSEGFIVHFGIYESFVVVVARYTSTNDVYLQIYRTRWPRRVGQLHTHELRFICELIRSTNIENLQLMRENDLEQFQDCFVESESEQMDHMDILDI